MDGARGAREKSGISAKRSGAVMYSAFECGDSRFFAIVAAPIQRSILFKSLIVGAVLLIDYFAEPALEPVDEATSPS
jgi:hypothetical protein